MARKERCESQVWITKKNGSFISKKNRFLSPPNRLGDDKTLSSNNIAMITTNTKVSLSVVRNLELLVTHKRKYLFWNKLWLGKCLQPDMWHGIYWTYITFKQVTLKCVTDMRSCKPTDFVNKKVIIF